MDLFLSVRNELLLIPEIAETQKESEDVQREEISRAQMVDAYQSIIEVSKSLDYDTLTFILDSIKKYQLPEKDQKITRKIGEMAYKLQWDEIVNLANEGLSEQEN